MVYNTYMSIIGKVYALLTLLHVSVSNQ